MAALNKVALAPTPVRCAVYTRKSTEEGLNQDFNSLDAQREAAEAYIIGQKRDGWTLLPTQYSDGGYTGANLERPGVRQLLADIQTGKIDCVVVYKVDRLSRSLIDFAKMMDLFDKNGVCFVSVTQQFNTNTPLGRLTLHILLSFAQFEREIISERTRDKQVAARKKGKWTGGHLVLGYDLDPRGRRLVANQEEAERVREIFGLYLEGTSVTEIVRRADRLGWRNKQWTTQDGKPHGGSPLRRCHIYNLLGNVLYTGRMKVGDEAYTGEHEEIIDQTTFDMVKERLSQSPHSRDSQQDSGRRKMDALLRGIIYCSCCGSAMYPTYSTSKERRYRYYICIRAQEKTGHQCPTRSVSAPAVEEAVVERIRRIAVAPEVLEETARVLRQRLAEQVHKLREELADVNAKLKNWKSQLARMRQADVDRETGLRDQVVKAEARAADLRAEIERCQRFRLNDKELRKQFAAFDELWKAMNLQEQTKFVICLVEKVGYDGRTGKVIVSFKSATIKNLCKK